MTEKEIKDLVKEHFSELAETYGYGITRNKAELFEVFKSGIELGLEIYNYKLKEKLKNE